MPITTLWDMFVSALRFTRGTAQAAVAVIHAAPAAQAPAKLLDAVNTTQAAPTLGAHGQNIEGIKTVNLVWKNSLTGTTTFTLHLWDGEEWAPLETIEVEGTSGILPPLDTEGFGRIAASIQDADISGAGSFTLKLFPFNEET